MIVLLEYSSCKTKSNSTNKVKVFAKIKKS